LSLASIDDPFETKRPNIIKIHDEISTADNPIILFNLFKPYKQPCQ